MKNLTSSGHRTAPREAKYITEQMEQELWGKLFLDEIKQKKTFKNSLFLSWQALCSQKSSRTPRFTPRSGKPNKNLWYGTNEKVKN